jgi:hypothetical protein
MQDFVTLHLFNIENGQENALIQYVDGIHADRVRVQRGFKSAQMFRCSPHQLLPEIRQAWTYAVLYESTSATPEIDLPAIAPLLANLRESGLIAPDNAERIYSFGMYHPWKYSANYRPGPLTHLMFLLANLVPGHEVEYHDWYDRVHSVEVSETPGYVGMRRGLLSAIQVPPVRHCPGDQLILGAIQTDSLAENLKEFVDRAYGRSPSGVTWGERSSAASLARTVHIFESIAGPYT